MPWRHVCVVEVKLHTSLTSALHAGKWSVSAFDCFIPGQWPSVTHKILWSGHCGKEKISAPAGNWTGSSNSTAFLSLYDTAVYKMSILWAISDDFIQSYHMACQLDWLFCGKSAMYFYWMNMLLLYTSSYILLWLQKIWTEIIADL